jgi:hypothetical protein
LIVLGFILFSEFIVQLLSALTNSQFKTNNLDNAKDIIVLFEMTGLAYYFYDMALCKIDHELILDEKGHVIHI